MSESSSADYQQGARQRMERWLLSEGLRQFMHDAADVRDRPERTGCFIALSREAGTGGGHVARLVGRQLNWDVLGKELLDFMTQRYSMPRERLDSVDETQSNWFHDMFGGWFDRGTVAAEDYVFHLEKIIYLAALHGDVIFVGRGAHCILPRECGLNVRIMAPFEWRVERLMRQRSLDPKQARQMIESLDAGRHELCKYYFQRELSDPAQFDLIVNAQYLTDEAMARLIVTAYQERFGPAKAGE